MDKLQWTTAYELGIPVIDAQHRRIVEYINQLIDAARLADTQISAQVLAQLMDYTQSHFLFEEAMLEDVGYEALTIHQRTHAAFSQRIEAYQADEQLDSQRSLALASLLKHWLFNHILQDDSSYSELVKTKML